jgi:glycosyltransferase involved in cell wall biosynthesis
VGVSICRNKGLERAAGEYIYFFDSDDVLEPNCLEICCSKLNQTKADFLIFDGDSFSEEGIKQSFNATYQRTHLLKSEIYKGVDLIRLLIDKKSYSCSICLCVIRKSYLDRIQLKFYPGVLFEDMLFTAHLYLAAQTVSFSPNSFFKRRIRANSTMTSTISKKNIEYRFTVGDELLKLKNQFSDSQSKSILNHQARSIFIFLVKLLLRNGQFNLLFRNVMRIKWLIFRSFWK